MNTEAQALPAPAAWQVLAYGVTQRIVVREDVADECARQLCADGASDVEVRSLYNRAAIEAAVTEARAVPEGWTDADADAARLALELECLLTDRDVPMPALSRWWDSAHEALRLHRERLAATPSPAEQPKPAVPDELLAWAVSRWESEVRHRPLVNKNRRSLDDTWRQVIRFAGGDPDALLGPAHDALLAALQGEQHDQA